MHLRNTTILSCSVFFDGLPFKEKNRTTLFFIGSRWWLAAVFLCFAFVLPAQDLLQKRLHIKQPKGATVYILQDISQQTGIVFSYSNKICLNSTNDLSSAETSIQSILDQLFRLCPASYTVKGNKVIIEPMAKGTRRFVVKGFVRDYSSGEALIGANIYEPYILTGQNSNNFGFYSLALPEGVVSVYCSFVGCQTQSHSFYLDRDTILNFRLQSSVDIEQVDVLGTRKPGKVQSTATGIIDLPVEQIQNVPAFLGEVDVIKTLQMAPGVQSGSEGVGGLYVRGGGSDENMILLDDVPIYNVSHMLGFFSVFNADAINKVTMIKSGFPARYGGRLSSVLDIRLKEGNLEEYHGVASFGLLSSRLSVEGPVVKGKSSFYVSGRRTYLDLFSTPLQLKKDEKINYYFYDFNAKFNYILSSRDRLYLSVFLGKDDYATFFNYRTVPIIKKTKEVLQDVTINDETGSGWGNEIVSSRWNHVFGETLFMNVTLLYSNFRFFVEQLQNSYRNEAMGVFKQRYYSGIRDGGAKVDFDYFPTSSNHLRFGVNYTFHGFFPGIDVFQSTESDVAVRDTTVGEERFFRPEYHGYIENDFSLGDHVKMNLGLHFSALSAGKTNYGSFEPRVSFLYLLRDNLSIKTAYTEMTQYIHLVRSASIMLPSDMWLPVSDQIKPLRSRQLAAGVEWDINKGTSLSVEAYYKQQRHILTYRESSGLFNVEKDWASRLVSGNGESYGIEFFFHKKVGRMSGWLGYTLSKTENQFDQINQGKAFAANYDRRHDISLFNTFKFSEGTDLSFNWIFGSGYPVTLPTQKYYSPDLPTQSGLANGSGHDLIEGRNNFRMPAIHRLDLGLNFTSQKSWGTRIWSFGIYNTYSRQNPFFLYFGEKVDAETNTTVRVLKQYSIFPIPLPYARVTIKF